VDRSNYREHPLAASNLAAEYDAEFAGRESCCERRDIAGVDFCAE
jgi:hypothetical protein